LHFVVVIIINAVVVTTTKIYHTIPTIYKLFIQRRLARLGVIAPTISNS
jgi:hypothetical protein